MIDAIETGLWPVDAQTYHADTSAVSHSALEIFRRSVPLYHALFIERSMQREEPTPTMKLGTALHTWLLERQRFADLVAVTPDIDRRTKAGKAEWECFTDLHLGKTIITAEQMALVLAMTRGVYANPLAGQLLSERGPVEAAIRWRTGDIACKARIDKAIYAGPIIDIKTSSAASPAEWARLAAPLGYHRQMAWYMDGWAAIGRECSQFLHIVVCNQPPHEAFVVEMDGDAIGIGRMENHQLLAELTNCTTANQWASRWADRVNQVTLPRWYGRE